MTRASLMSKILVLRLKGRWWDEIATGSKSHEIRLQTDYWRKRLIDRDYDEVHLWRGYPPKTDTSKLLIRPWRPVTTDTIVHEEFGSDLTPVFMIDVRIQ